MLKEPQLNIRDKILGPEISGRRPRRAAYALPTLFTSANILLGFVAILKTFEAALKVSAGDAAYNHDFQTAARAIGFAVFFDGIDGYIARLTKTTSDFGRELDSIADVITFGIAPAVLAYVWGVLFVAGPAELSRAGYCIAFFFLLCGAVRLARFNVLSISPKPDMKYFVGMPIPAGAGFVAATIHLYTEPMRSVIFSIGWLCLLAVIGLLMVSTWRYPSFKQLNVGKPRTPLMVLVVGGLIFVIWQWSQPVLMGLATAYVLSGILIRLGSFVRRRRRMRAAAARPEEPLTDEKIEPEQQIG
jgi:CDP-diacylglycerol--serine O-phosphatidyltransferase